MTNQLTTIDLNALVPQSQLPAHLQNVPSIVGKIPTGDTRNRIGLKGREFHIIRGGNEDGVTDTKYLDVVIIGAVPAVSRQYYDKRYVEGEGLAPSCYSKDGNVPSADVAHPQNPVCNTCPQNQKGSSLNADEGSKGRACGFFRRMAVLLPTLDDTPIIYQLDVKSMSLWGDSDEKNNRYSLQDYAKKLQAAGHDLGKLITRMWFTNASVPVVQFQPIDWISQEQVTQILKLIDEGQVAPVLDVTMATVDISQAPPPAAQQSSEPAKPQASDRPTLKPSGTQVAAPAPAATPAPAAQARPVLRPTLKPAVTTPQTVAQPQTTQVAAPAAPRTAPPAAAEQNDIDALIAELG